MSNEIVNGNSAFTRVRNLATSNIQYLTSDSVVATDLRLGAVTTDPSTRAGQMGDIKVFVDATASPPTAGAIYVCVKSGVAGVAVWLSASLA